MIKMEKINNNKTKDEKICLGYNEIHNDFFKRR